MNLTAKLQVVLTFIPSHLDTARSGRSALRVRKALNAPIFDNPAPSAPSDTSEIC